MIALALAGGFGAALRLMIDELLRPLLGDRLPWGTLTINVLGSILLGALTGATASAHAIAVLGTGFAGGFTTFSTASFETASLAFDRRWTAATNYALGTLVACLSGAALGYFLAASIAA